jgi:hypothetical protein
MKVARAAWDVTTESTEGAESLGDKVEIEEGFLTPQTPFGMTGG